ncbi:hypothetical protein V6N12_010521 [Hibiscus sabdariffa]|uniref:Uncharacterized protein n=1 Tax=Hibiscus sabdariffa TaxID=183260 RepID=A0ABR2ELV4_9ROSI
MQCLTKRTYELTQGYHHYSLHVRNTLQTSMQGVTLKRLEKNLTFGYHAKAFGSPSKYEVKEATTEAIQDDFAPTHFIGTKYKHAQEMHVSSSEHP